MIPSQQIDRSLRVYEQSNDDVDIFQNLFLFQIKMASRLLNTFAKRCPAALFIIVYEIHTSCVEPLR